MLSLRAVARAAPRSAAQFASTSSCSTLRPALQTALRSSRIATRIPRYFSISHSRFDDASQELAAKLSDEMRLESEEDSSPADSDSNIKHFLDQNSQWTIEDNTGEQEVQLKRKYDDEEITVSFSIADFNSPMMDGEDPDEAMMDDEEDIQTAQSGGANTKGAVNQGRTSGGNIKVAPEDSVAPGDREDMRDAEDENDGQAAFPASVNVLIQRPGKVSIDLAPYQCLVLTCVGRAPCWPHCRQRCLQHSNRHPSRQVHRLQNDQH